MKKQAGMALVVSLIFLVILTILGVTAVSRGTTQTKMATIRDIRSMQFEGAEASIEGVIHEQENPDMTAADKVLSQARGDTVYDPASPGGNVLECFNSGRGRARYVTSDGLAGDNAFTTIKTMAANPGLDAWSRTVFIGEDPYLGLSGEAETVDSDIALHAFIVRGCGHVEVNPVATANSVVVSARGPRSE